MIKPQDVKNLRDKTGAGFADCKKALEEANGDFAGAEKILKEMGLAQAEKRSSREATEGRVFTYLSKDKAAILRLSCETDFVSRNDEFVKAGETLIKNITDSNLNIEDKTVVEQIASIGAKCKENVSISKYNFTKIDSNEVVYAYIHGEAGGTGSLIKLAIEDKTKIENAKIQELVKDLALHLVAFKPAYKTADEVPQDYKKENLEIFTKQVNDSGKADGKSPEVVAKMINGKLEKHLQEICFLSQAFVKDDKNTVEKILEITSKEIQTKISIAEYFVY